jgi:hypothetical protein
MASEKNAREIVLSCVRAINEEDFERARRYVRDDFSFVGALGARNGANAYFDDMPRMRIKYDVKKVFVDGSDVCLFYDFTISGVTAFGCAWYQVDGERIRSLQVVFDPRPFPQTKPT